MAKLLPPTLGERVAQCGTRVDVWGITAGADVTLDVDGTAQAVLVNATSHTFAVPALAPNARLRARQKLGADQSALSNELIAEPVALPPGEPMIERELPRCIHSIFASGVAPGSKVEVQQGTVIAAQGLADRAGYACMAVTEPHPAFYAARTITCGAASPSLSIKLTPALGYIPRPTIVEPVFECQSAVAFQRLIPGAVYEIFVIDGGAAESSLGTFVACTPNMTVGVPRLFRHGDRVQARGTMFNVRWQCDVRGAMSYAAAVVPPDDRIKPVIEEPVWEDDPLIRVTNQIEGGTISLKRKADAQAAQEDDLGSRPSSRYPDVPPGTRLHPDNVIRVIQELCGVSRASDPVTVRRRPAVINPPTIRRPVLDCAEAIVVDDVIPGATVWVRQLPTGGSGVGFLLGKAVSLGSSVAVPLAPRAFQNHEVFAHQEISGAFSAPSNREPVDFREFIPEPVVWPPVQFEDTHVWCDNLLVGAHVRILDVRNVGGADVEVQIGAGVATGTLTAIPLWTNPPPFARIVARQVLCRQSRPSAEEKEDSRQDCAGPPQWEPAKWNTPSVQPFNNCYNYACDLPLGNWAQPGGGGPLADNQCHIVGPRAVSDGLRVCPNGNCHPCHHKVALVINPCVDFHWYRQDANGMWSHKRAWNAAKNVDESGNPITNPETADRDAYTQFCGYFCVYKPKTTLRTT